MYDGEIAMTGLGALVIGPLVIDVWWAAAALMGAGLVCIVVARRLRSSKHRH
jgi:hypothetical protein